MQWSHIQDPNLKAVSTLVAQTLLRRWCQDYFFLLPISKSPTADLPEQTKNKLWTKAHSMWYTYSLVSK